MSDLFCEFLNYLENMSFLMKSTFLFYELESYRLLGRERGRGIFVKFSIVDVVFLGR